ncbi:MAG: type II secretion system F family protein [Pirellula sp.]|jgi:general secretion pathway protein F/type IV pilus assembly protein PilC|nr:type II secretion system F family protein [Pirellula sp.]
MPDFAYIARDLAGKSVTGTVTAASTRDAAMQLGSKSLFPISIKVDKTRQVRKTGRVSGSQMASFYGQMASLLRSGVPMLKALTVLSQQSGSSRTLRNAISEIKAKVEEGESLPDAMARYPKIFNDMAVNMTRAGSEGGFLEDALERVSGFVEQQEELKGKTLGALAYPVFVMGVGVVVVTVLLIFFVPKFEGIFQSMRAKEGLPAATELLLGISKFVQNYWWVVLGAIAGLVLLLKKYLDTTEGQYRADLIKIKTPLIGGVFLNLAVARFCRVLGTLLKNGVPILRSLDISRNAAGNKILSEAVASASAEITAGQRLAKQLEKSGHFPPTVVEMISVAEESNTLDTVLVNIAENLERTTFRRLETVIRLLEPVMLLILAGLVMFVVLALMLPVLNSANTLG